MSCVYRTSGYGRILDTVLIDPVEVLGSMGLAGQDQGWLLEGWLWIDLALSLPSDNPVSSYHTLGPRKSVK